MGLNIANEAPDHTHLDLCRTPLDSEHFKMFNKVGYVEYDQTHLRCESVGSLSLCLPNPLTDLSLSFSFYFKLVE